MEHEELMKRIRRMPYEAIKLLSAKDIWRLTDGFDEELVKEIVAKNSTPKSQREAIVFMKNSRIFALQAIRRPITEHPEYFEDWIFDLNTGVLIEGAAPTKKEEVVAGISKVTDMVGDKFREFNAEKAQLQSNIDELDAQLEQVTAEKDALKKQLEEYRKQPQAGEMQTEGNDEWVVELLSHYCFEDTQVARNIIEEMRDKTDPEVADIIFERKHRNEISPKTHNIDLWRVLHAARLYESDSYQNLDTALRRREKRKGSNE